MNVSCNSIFIGCVVLATIAFVGVQPGTGVLLCLMLVIFMKLDEIHHEILKDRLKG